MSDIYSIPSYFHKYFYYNFIIDIILTSFGTGTDAGILEVWGGPLTQVKFFVVTRSRSYPEFCLGLPYRHE